MTPRHSPSTYAAAPAPFARHGRYILQNRPRTRRRWAAIQSPGRPARPATKPRPAVSSLAPPHQPGQAASARSGSCPCSQRHRGRAGTMLNVRRAGRASVAAQRPAAAAPLHWCARLRRQPAHTPASARPHTRARRARALPQTCPCPRARPVACVDTVSGAAEAQTPRGRRTPPCGRAAARRGGRAPAYRTLKNAPTYVCCPAWKAPLPCIFPERHSPSYLLPSGQAQLPCPCGASHLSSPLYTPPSASVTSAIAGPAAPGAGSTRSGRALGWPARSMHVLGHPPRQRARRGCSVPQEVNGYTR